MTISAELRLARLQPPGLGADLEHRRQARVVDVDRRLRQRVAGLDEPRPVLVREPPGAQPLQLDAALGAHQALRDLDLRHLEREHGDRDAVVEREVRRDARARTPTCPCSGGRRRSTRLPGWRPEVIWSTSRKPVGVPVISPPDSYILVICSKLSRTSTSTCSKLPRIRCWARSKTICSARSTSSGVSPGRSQPSRWICSPTSREAAQRRHLAHDLRVVAGVRGRRHERRELVDPLLAADLVELAALVELVGDGDRVDRLAVLVELERGAVDLRRATRGRSRRRRGCRSPPRSPTPRASSRRGRTPRHRDFGAERGCYRLAGRDHRRPSETARGRGRNAVESARRKQMESAGFAGMTEHMFADPVDGVWTNPGARSGKFGAKSTARGHGCGESGGSTLHSLWKRQARPGAVFPIAPVDEKVRNCHSR